MKLTWLVLLACAALARAEVTSAVDGVNQGAAFLKSKQPAEAVKVLSAALKLEPKNTKVLQLLAVALFRSGRAEAAQKVAKRLQALDPANATAQKILARAPAAAPAASAKPMPAPPPEPAATPAASPEPVAKASAAPAPVASASPAADAPAASSRAASAGTRALQPSGTGSASIDGKSFGKLEDAIKAAKPGDTILVRGVFDESVEIKKDLSLIGDPEAGFTKRGTIKTYGNVTMKGLQFSCSDYAVMHYEGKLTMEACEFVVPEEAFMVKGAKAIAVLRNVSFRDVKYNAVKAEDGGTLTLERCKVSELKGKGTVGVFRDKTRVTWKDSLVDAPPGSTMDFGLQSTNVIEGCRLDCRIDLKGSSRISNTDITADERLGEVMDGKHAFENVTFTQRTKGTALLFKNPDVEFKKCAFTGGELAISTGYYETKTGTVTVEDSTFTGLTYDAISIYTGVSATVRRSTFTNIGNAGVRVVKSAKGATIEGCTFKNVKAGGVKVDEGGPAVVKKDNRE